MKKKRLFMLTGLLTLWMGTAAAQPYLVDAGAAERVRTAVERGDTRLKPLYDRALRDADKLLAEPDPAVTDKGMTPPAATSTTTSAWGVTGGPTPTRRTDCPTSVATDTRIPI